MSPIKPGRIHTLVFLQLATVLPFCFICCLDLNIILATVHLYYLRLYLLSLCKLTRVIKKSKIVWGNVDSIILCVSIRLGTLYITIDWSLVYIQ